MSNTIRVLLVDDSPALRAGLRTLLEQTPDITVVGEAQDAMDAVVQIGALLPDVIILDCRLREVEGGVFHFGGEFRVPPSAPPTRCVGQGVSGAACSFAAQSKDALG